MTEKIKKMEEIKEEINSLAEAEKDKNDRSSDDKKSLKKEEKTQVKVKKDEAIAKGTSVPISKKHSMYICSFIKNKKIDDAIKDLEKVMKMKKAVPFKGEIPHRKGMMSGRYPVNAAREFIRILKGLKGNCIVNEMNIEDTKIAIASASWASRPLVRGGMKSKRVNIIIRARENNKGENK